MGLVNEFGWSISREAMFDECRRRYYFHYYLSWGGWDQGAPRLSQAAFRLKRLTSLALWRGQLVHYVATKVLASLRAKGRIPAFEDVKRYIVERFETQLAFSREGRYRTEPKKRGGELNIDWLALFDHEYGRPPDPERLERARGECVEAMRALLESPILARIADTDPDGWAIENIDLGEFAQVFDFEGARVFAKTDFMYRGRDGTFNIVDWKTFSGARSDDGDGGGKARVQLGVYGYYAASVLGEPLERIRLVEVNLLDDARETEYAAGPEDIELFREHIRSGIDKLAGVLTGGDISRNEALPPRHFPLIDNGRCRYCNFFRICKDEANPDRLPA
jgi:hypothetical protein